MSQAPSPSALLITGGTLVDAHTPPRPCHVLVRHDRIAAIGNWDANTLLPLRSTPGVEELDATGCFILPGGIDPHTHFELTVGGQHVFDNFATGTLAALSGGNTSIIEHPAFAPPEKSHDLFHQMRLWRKLAHGHAHVDYGLHLVFQPPAPHFSHGIAEENTKEYWPALNNLPEAMTQGYSSGKAYTTYEGKLTDAELLRLMAAMKEVGCLLTVHAENDAIVAWLRMYGALDPHSPRSHPASRPPQCEAEAVTRVLALARSVDIPVYVVHVSTAAALEAIRRARRAGQTVYAETCPQYLLLTDKAYAETDGIRYVMAPPLRSPQDTDALWQALLHGDIDVLATDHCSFSLAQKKAAPDIFTCPGGIPGVETRLPLLFTHGVLRQGMDMQRFAALTSGNAARIFGLPDKGLLTPGQYADITVLDPDIHKNLNPQNLRQNVDYCPFSALGSTAGWPRHVILRGHVLLRDGTLIGAHAPQGQFIRRLP